MLYNFICHSRNQYYKIFISLLYVANLMQYKIIIAFDLFKNIYA